MKALIAAGTVGIALVVAALAQRSAKTPCEPGEGPVATVGGVPITAAELQGRVGDRLLAVKTSEYEMRRDILSDLITERLEKQEAERRGISVEALLAAEVDAKVAPVTEQEKRMHYEAIKARAGNRPAAQVMADIEQALKEQRHDERLAAFASELQTKAGVQVLLDPPRARSVPGDDPALGPASAPVTIVEFSDFQCPYCAHAAPPSRGSARATATACGWCTVTSRSPSTPTPRRRPKPHPARASRGSSGRCTTGSSSARAASPSPTSRAMRASWA
jgi:hypothetical protein